MAPKTVQECILPAPEDQKARWTSSRPGSLCKCLLMANMRIEQTIHFLSPGFISFPKLQLIRIYRDEGRVENAPRATIRGKQTSKRVYPVPIYRSGHF